MTVLVQPETDIRCVAFVAAMATGTTIDEFERFARDHPISGRITPPFEDLHFYGYALSRGYICGFRLMPDGGSLPDIPPEEIAIGVKFPITMSPAYVVVEGSLDKSWNHAVYWDGRHIVDPSPYSKNPRHPSEYVIKSWTPIYRLE